MSELLGLDQPPQSIPEDPAMPSSASMHAKLVKADYHGSILTGKINALSDNHTLTFYGQCGKPKTHVSSAFPELSFMRQRMLSNS